MGVSGQAIQRGEWTGQDMGVSGEDMGVRGQDMGVSGEDMG